MRATVKDVARHPSWLPEWWRSLPARKRDWWFLLLFEKGQGWLRWGFEERTDYQGVYLDEGLYAPEYYTVAPPLRRLWCALKWNLAIGWWGALRGHWGWEAALGGFHEIGALRDPDRKGQF